MSVIIQLQKLLSDLNEIISLGNDGLLKSERLYGTKYRVEDELKKIASF